MSSTDYLHHARISDLGSEVDDDERRLYISSGLKVRQLFTGSEASDHMVFPHGSSIGPQSDNQDGAGLLYTEIYRPLRPACRCVCLGRLVTAHCPRISDSERRFRKESHNCCQISALTSSSSLGFSHCFKHTQFSCIYNGESAIPLQSPYVDRTGGPENFKESRFDDICNKVVQHQASRPRCVTAINYKDDHSERAFTATGAGFRTYLHRSYAEY